MQCTDIPALCKELEELDKKLQTPAENQKPGVSPTKEKTFNATLSSKLRTAICSRRRKLWEDAVLWEDAM